MHSIFTVTSEKIRSLNDIQARELLARLCKAELRENGLSTAFVTWGGDQRAPDGGVDVRVDITPNFGINGYIIKDATIFQVKAETFPKTKILKEMRVPKLDQLRPVIVEIASKHGAYVIVSTKDNTSDSSLKDRKDAMTYCLEANGLAGKVIVDFYDSQKIADWVEKHPVIVIWLNEALGSPIFGWQPYAPWAYRENDINSEYILDEKVKVTVPNSDKPVDAISAINQLRNKLNENVSVRIIGLSGVGKTRLAQALFDKRIVTHHPALDQENVIYTDLSNNPNPQPSAMIEALISEGSDSIIVIDNCGPDVHQNLTALVKRPDSKLRLITIEYDLREDLPEDTFCYRLEGSSNAVIKTLLKRRFRILSEIDIDKITEFSDGNARIASALAATSETTGELAQLKDADLFKRLFVQKNESNDELLRCAEVASLLYSFNAEDTSDESELAILSSIAEIPILSFSRNIEELFRRGLLQKRGEMRAVLPHAIANRLATKALDSYPKNALVEKLTVSATARIARSFSRRLGYLHESKIAQDIVKEWLSLGGSFGDLTSLDDDSKQIFTNIAPVHQQSTLEALLRATKDKGFISTDNRNRLDFARIARSLAYQSNLFDGAVKILIDFALEESGASRQGASDMLKSLFYCRLSGSEAPPNQRAAMLKELIIAKDIKKQKLGLLVLSAALEASHFSSHYEFDFGATKRNYGWWPRDQNDVNNWYIPFVDIVIEIGANNTPIGRDVRAILGRSFRGLWTNASLVDVLKVAAEKLVSVYAWPEGWLGVRNVMQWDKGKIPPQSLAILLQLEKKLAPHNLYTTIQAKILCRGSLEYEHDDEAISHILQYERTAAEAIELGKSATLESDLLPTLLTDLLQKDTNSKVYQFGVGVGKNHKSCHELLNQAKDLIKNGNKNQFNLMFIRGVIYGWYNVKPDEVSKFLDDAISDDVWGERFPELQTQVFLDDYAHARLMKSLELGLAPIRQYINLAYVSVIDSLSISKICSLISAIDKMPDNGAHVALDLLYMVVYSAKEKSEEYRTELIKFCIKFLQEFNWAKFDHSNDNESLHLGTVLEYALESNASEKDVSIILQKLVDIKKIKEIGYSYRKGDLLKPFFRLHPKLTLDTIYFPDNDGNYYAVLNMLSNWCIDPIDKGLTTISSDAFLEWCEISPSDRFVFAAYTCQLFEKSVDTEGHANLNLSNIAKKVFNKAEDKEKVLKIFVDRFYPSSWSGSLANVLRDRQPLIDQLDITDDPVMQETILNIKKEFNERIKQEEKREEYIERSNTGRFE
jgi:hypothetical protein